MKGKFTVSSWAGKSLYSCLYWHQKLYLLISLPILVPTFPPPPSLWFTPLHWPPCCSFNIPGLLQPWSICSSCFLCWKPYVTLQLLPSAWDTSSAFSSFCPKHLSPSSILSCLLIVYLSSLCWNADSMRAEIIVFADKVSKIVPGTEEVLNKYLLMNCEDSMWHCK